MNENKDLKNINNENDNIDEFTPIAPPTELPPDHNDIRVDKNEFVWSRVDKLEKTIHRIFILSIVSMFGGILGFFCCCNIGSLLNIAVIVLGFVYISEVSKISKIGDFSEFDLVRINDLKKKARLILIFGIIGLAVSVISFLIPFLMPFILGTGYGYY